MDEVQNYKEFYETSFGAKALTEEASYLRQSLKDALLCLDVGCGPAAFEKMLPELDVVGLDPSPEMLEEAVKQRPGMYVQATAEALPFRERSFDGLFFVSSLSFTKDYRKSISEAKRVLSPGGRLAAILCNTESGYFKKKIQQTGYTQKHIKHTKMQDILYEISRHFDISGQYMVEDPKSGQPCVYSLNGVPN